jgi:hypothetical protein
MISMRIWSPLHKQRRDRQSRASRYPRAPGHRDAVARPCQEETPAPASQGLWIMCAGAGGPSSQNEWLQCVTMGVLQVAHGCVEKTADKHGLLRGVEQSTVETDGAAIIGLMHGQSTNGSSRDMQQQGDRVQAQSCRAPQPGNAY